MLKNIAFRIQVLPWRNFDVKTGGAKDNPVKILLEMTTNY